MKSLVKISFFNILYNLATLIFPLIIVGYVSRILLPEGVGRVSYAQNFASYFVEFAALGLPIYGVREIAKAGSDHECEVFSELVVINFVWSFVIAFCYLLIIFRKNCDLTLFFACGIPVFLNFLNIEWFYQGKEEYGFIAFRSITIKCLSLVSVFLFVKTKKDYTIYALITSVATVGNYLFNLIHSRKMTRFSLRNLQIARHMRPLAKLATVLILSEFYAKVDITMLNYFAEEKSIGFYSNSQKIIEIIITICTSVTATFLPRFCYYNKEDREKLMELLNTGFKIITFIAVPASVGLFIIAPKLTVLLFGQEFFLSARVIRTFVPMILIRTYGDLFCYRFLIAMGDEGKRIYSNIIAIIVNASLNYLLIPKIAECGAAISSVATELVIDVFLIGFLVIRRNVSLSGWLREVLKCIVASAVMGVSVLWIYEIDVPFGFSCVLSVFCGVVIYAITSIIIKTDTMMWVMDKVRTSLKK